MKLSDLNIEIVTPKTKCDEFLHYLKLRFPNYGTRIVEDKDSWGQWLQMKFEGSAGRVELSMKFDGIDTKPSLEDWVQAFEKLIRGEN